MSIKYGFIKNAESNVFHIVKGKFDYLDDYFKRQKILCSYNQILKEKIFNNKLYDENTIREKAAELQNKGYDICGNCIRELYSKKD